MLKKTPKKNIPAEFRRYFWDINFDELNFNAHKNFILERLLNYGAFSTFSWIFQTYKNEEVKQFLSNKAKHSLSKNSFYFWQKISNEKSLWKKNLI